MVSKTYCDHCGKVMGDDSSEVEITMNGEQIDTCDECGKKVKDTLSKIQKISE